MPELAQSHKNMWGNFCMEMFFKKLAKPGLFLIIFLLFTWQL